MIVAVAIVSLFPTSSPQPESGAKNFGKHNGLNSSVDVRRIKSKSTSSGGMQIKTNAQAPTKVNSTRVGVLDGLKTDDNSSSAAPRTFINQFPDWSMLLAAITTIFLAILRSYTQFKWVFDSYLMGCFGLFFFKNKLMDELGIYLLQFDRVEYGGSDMSLK
ncbi:acyl-ACP thioesterase [Tanacetum coccineum]